MRLSCILAFKSLIFQQNSLFLEYTVTYELGWPLFIIYQVSIGSS